MAKYKVVTQKPAGVTFDLADGHYTLERLSLDPIGAEIVEIDAASEEEFISEAKDADAIIGRGRRITKNIIDSLENYQRGIYTGALGTISSNGNMDFNIAIRTMIIERNMGTYPVGGGIVWDSEPLEEWQEAQQKSRIIDMYQNSFESINQNFNPIQTSKYN